MNTITKAEFDSELESWKAGSMKTTIDLPEDLVREMKFRAVREGRKLREVAEEVFRRGAKPFKISGKRLLELEREAEGESPGA